MSDFDLEGERNPNSLTSVWMTQPCTIYPLKVMQSKSPALPEASFLALIPILHVRNHGICKQSVQPGN